MGKLASTRPVSVGFLEDWYYPMPVSLSSAVQEGSLKSLLLRFANNTKSGRAAYSDAAGGPTELCRPPGLLDLHKPKHLNRGKHRGMHQGTKQAGQIYLPSVGGKLQGSVRESLCSKNKKRKQCTHAQKRGVIS